VAIIDRARVMGGLFAKVALDLRTS